MTFGSHISMRAEKPRRLIFAMTTLLLLATGLLCWRALNAPVDLAAAEYNSTMILDRKGHLLRAFASKDGRWRLPLKLNQTSPNYLKLLIAYEDQNYYHHHGIDPPALMRAGWQWLRNGHIVSGGSTLTMQVARLLNGNYQRSLSAKWQQILTGLRLDHQLSKQQILELYFKLAPFGGNLEGVRAASLAYLGKEPKKLSLAESALLVALPQSPEARRPDRHPERARQARDKVLKRALKKRVITKSEYLYAVRQPIPHKRHNFPALAAHLAEQIKANHARKQTHKTTLSRQLQEDLETHVRAHLHPLGAKLSAALMVVDLKDGAIRAHIGSVDYFDYTRQGPIDMTRPKRSPGSTLKPFIYGLGFDYGFAHPSTLIEDGPVRFGLYAPENFDGEYHGTVSIRQALQKSLNIPAVKMLAAIKPARLATRFEMAGIHSTIPHNLAIALGGVGLNLKDLMRAYLHLAAPERGLNMHHLARSRYPPKNQSPHKKERAYLNRPMMSKKAANYITQILRSASPPKNAKPGGLAYKTGTSYGYRDAWALGYDGRYLIGVWVGRADGASTAGITGLGTAAPLLFDAFQIIAEKRSPFPVIEQGLFNARTEELPPPLQFFGRRAKNHNRWVADHSEQLRIVFPPNQASFEQSHSRPTLPISLKAQGGTLPLTWMVNGTPVTSKPFKREALMLAKERGFLELSVIDAKGQIDQVNIRVH